MKRVVVVWIGIRVNREDTIPTLARSRDKFNAQISRHGRYEMSTIRRSTSEELVREGEILFRQIAAEHLEA